jgi:hypothetical protein
MYRLYEHYYGGTSEDQFRADLAAKNYVLLLRSTEEGDGSLVGFSTQAIIEYEFEAKRESAVFSGDTIIDHRYWGDQALPKAFCEFAATLCATQPDQPLYWLLISKGHRTYRYLNAFAWHYFPQPPELLKPFAVNELKLQQRSALIARHLFGEKYNASKGIVRFSEGAAFLKPQWHVESEKGKRKSEGHAKSAPIIQHFETLNPGFREGDELVCITELTKSNLRGLAKKAFDSRVGYG